MPKTKSLVLLSLQSPLLCGVYEDNRLIHSYCKEGKTLDNLTYLHTQIHDQPIKQIFYAKGPGSFTAIKLTHIFLQTLSLLKGIELFSQDAFYFNQNTPIKAFGNQYFCKEGEKISLHSLENPPCTPPTLPPLLFPQDFTQDNEPLYILPAIQGSL